MSKPQFCHTCIFYEKEIFTRHGDEKFGICSNVSVSMKVALDGATHMEEDGTFYTEQYFGCIYWRENNGVLIDTSAIIKKNFSDEELKKMANDLLDEIHSSLPPDVKCSNCGAQNCANNKTCIKCNSQL